MHLALSLRWWYSMVLQYASLLLHSMLHGVHLSVLMDVMDPGILHLMVSGYGHTLDPWILGSTI